jgi:coenzyme PQQ precursor peptide PqqA
MNGPSRHKWETPAFEEIRVSAEATAYMGIWDSDWT